MFAIFTSTPTLAQAAPSPGGDLLPMLLMMGVSFFIFYWFLIRPQNIKQKETEAMLAALKKNDRVLTSAGILGTVSSIKDKEVTLRVDDKGAHLTFRRDAIIQVLEPSKSEPSKSESADSKDKDSTGNGKKK